MKPLKHMRANLLTWCIWNALYAARRHG